MAVAEKKLNTMKETVVKSHDFMAIRIWPGMRAASGAVDVVCAGRLARETKKA
jgi:hypothetical protein